MTRDQVNAAVHAALLAREELVERGVPWFDALLMAAVICGVMLSGGPAQ